MDRKTVAIVIAAFALGGLGACASHNAANQQRLDGTTVVSSAPAPTALAAAKAINPNPSACKAYKALPQNASQTQVAAVVNSSTGALHADLVKMYALAKVAKGTGPGAAAAVAPLLTIYDKVITDCATYGVTLPQAG